MRSTQPNLRQREDMRDRISSALQSMRFNNSSTVTQESRHATVAVPTSDDLDDASTLQRGLSDADACSYAADIEARAMERMVVCSGNIKSYCSFASQLLLQCLREQQQLSENLPTS